MKRWIMYVMGIMMAFSLAACKPTEVTETIPQAVGGGGNPAGLTPEMVKESNAAIERLPEQDAPVYEMAFIYYINSGKTGLVREVTDIEELTEEALVQCLIEKGVLEEGTEALGFGIEGGEKAGPGVDAADAGDGERIGTLDLSGIQQADAALEQLILDAIANTFIENYELDKLKLQIDGDNYTSENITQGDEDYLFYVDKYEKG